MTMGDGMPVGRRFLANNLFFLIAIANQEGVWMQVQIRDDGCQQGKSYGSLAVLWNREAEEALTPSLA